MVRSGCPIEKEDSMRVRILRLTSMISLLALSACTSSLDRDSAPIRKSMTSMIYVGENPAGTRFQTDVGPDPHGAQTQTLPSRLEEGRQYIFHRKKTTEYSWTILEQDLRANGATIIEAPKGNVGLSLPYVGGPFFVIRF